MNSSERYVILGLASPRSAWFQAVGHWSASASLAAEFVKCVSPSEVRARLSSGRPYSVLLVDMAAPGLDRDLVDECARHATPVVVVGPGGPERAAHVGAASALPAGFAPADLIEVLAVHCRPVPRSSQMPAPVEPVFADSLWQAPLYTVCGPGGTGASTVAIALASGLGGDPRSGGRVVLADLARRADQAVLHDSPGLGPGLQELVESHRLRRPDTHEIEAMTYEVPARGYRLLLGLRQPEAWSALRPRAIDAAIVGLRSAFGAVVADVTGDVEGEADGGSVDVEERNHLARSALRQSAVIVAVGSPGLKGIHSLALLLRQLVNSGVPSERILAAVNRSPRHPRARAEAARGLAELLQGSGITLALAGPLALPERKVEDAHRDGRPLPAALVDPLTRAVRAVAERVADEAPALHAPVPVAPGSLGWWDDAETSQ